MTLRVVLDTNVIISALATPQGVSGRIFNYWQDRMFDLVMSEYILDETRRILITKFKMQQSLVHKRLQVFSSLATMVNPAPVSIEGLDENDWPIIGTAVAGRAYILVTGDQQILALHSYRQIPIVTPRSFLDQIEKSAT